MNGCAAGREEAKQAKHDAANARAPGRYTTAFHNTPKQYAPLSTTDPAMMTFINFLLVRLLRQVQGGAG